MTTSEQKRVQELERQVALLEVQKKNVEKEIARERELRADAQPATASGLTVAELEEFVGYLADISTAWEFPKIFGFLLTRFDDIDACRRFGAVVVRRRGRMKSTVTVGLKRAEHAANILKATGRLPAGYRWTPSN